MKKKMNKNTKAATITGYSALWQSGNDGDDSKISMPASNLWLVNRCVQLKANKICSVPFRLEDKNGNPITDPIITNRVTHPNPYQSWHDFIAQTVLSFDVYGAFAWFVERNGNMVQNLFPLVPSRLKPLVRQNPVGFAYIAAWEYRRPDGNFITIPREDLVYVPQHDPYGGLVGKSTLDMARHVLHANMAAEEMNSWSLRNHAVPPGIIELPADIQDVQRDQFKKKLREEWRGHKQAQIPNLLPAGAKYVSLSPTFAELEFIDGLKLLRDDICALLGVPVREIFPQESGLNSGVSAEEDAKKFWRNGLFPVMARIEMAWQSVVMETMPVVLKKLPPQSKQISNRKFSCKSLHGTYFESDSGMYSYFEVHSIDVFYMERLSRIKEAVTAINSSLVSPNEAIRAFDLPFSDEDPAGEFRLAPFNVVPLATLMEPTVAAPSENKNSFQELASDSALLRDALRPLFLQNELQQTEDNQKAARDHKRKLFVSSATKAQDKLVKSGSDKLSSYFFSQRRRVLGGLEKMGRGNLITLREKSGKATRTLELFGASPQEAQKLTAIIKSIIDLGLNSGAQITNQILGKDIPLSAGLLDKLFETRNFVAESVNQATTSLLNTQWEEWLNSNEPSENLFERVRAVFNNSSKTSEGGRAFEISLTESGVGLNAGIAEISKAAGAPLKSWQSMGDARVREAHQKANNDYANGIPWADPFVVDGESLDVPRDARGSAGNVVNCRCVVVPLFN